MEVVRMWSRRLRAAALIVPVAAAVGCSAEFGDAEPEREPETLPEVQAFLDTHPEFGSRLVEAREMPPWAAGRRERIVTDSGRFLFYVHSEAGEVTAVYRYDENNARWPVFTKEIRESLTR